MRSLVLVGGGHTHVQILKRWAMEPVVGVRLTVVVDDPVAVYSGMVPGFVAGQYVREDLEIDIRPLAMRAGARMLHCAATGIDIDSKTVSLAGRIPISYDVASFDIGSTVKPSSLPGVPTRPISRFVTRVQELRGTRVGVVGGGAAGVEVAFALRAKGIDVTLFEAGSDILTEFPAGLRRRAKAHAKARGIEIRCNTRVENDSGFDALLLATGAAAHDLFDDSGLTTTRGFVHVRETLQLVDDDDVFAVGDCAHFTPQPLPKAGVFAVRHGPVLDENLRARLTGRSMRAYRPQRDFLALLNLGDGRAAGSKWGVSFEGRWVFRLKNHLDRSFMKKFQELDEMEGADEMTCGGCAAKVEESVLHHALSSLPPPVADDRVVLGLADRDDAAAVKTGEMLVVSTIDAFKAFTDDPFLVGEVAAANAASDLWAKGVEPRFAQAFVIANEERALVQVMAGARRALDGAGVTLLGGHTMAGEELTVGFAMWGETRDRLLRKAGLVPGDQLVLTKPLGTGVLFYADMRGLARGRWVEAGMASMRTTNQAASRLAREHGASACTDVSGFGLAGHLGEMCRASGVGARIYLDQIPVLDGVESLLRDGLRSTFHQHHPIRFEVDTPLAQVVLDPQTSGGLLFGVPAGTEVDGVIGEVVEGEALISLLPGRHL